MMKSNQQTNLGFGGNIYFHFWTKYPSNNVWKLLSSWIISFCFISRYLISFKNLLRAIENIGIVSVYGIKYLTTGKVTQNNFIKYVEHDTLIGEYLNSSIHLAPYLNEKFQNIYSSKAYKFYRERYLFIIIINFKTLLFIICQYILLWGYSYWKLKIYFNIS